MIRAEELEAKVKILNERTEIINKGLSDFKQILKNISPGLMTWIPTTRKNAFVGYCRVGNEWDLAIKYEEDGKDAEILSIFHARRDERLLMYKNMEVLLDALIKHVETMTRRMSKAIAQEEDEDNDSQS
jgi:hypothetical protein